jgi:AcrR family transcriptional regulator
MTVRNRIIETAAGLLTQSADVDVSTRAICDAAGVTAPTLYHHFGDKDGLLAAVVDFGWATFLETKLAVAAIVHDHVADDIRAGWDNHLQFARENPSFYKLMWSPAVAATSSAVREAYQMLYDRLELGAGRGQLRMSAEAASRMVLSATTGAALSLISQPDLYGDGAFATQLREAVIAWVTVPQGSLSATDEPEREAELSVASAAATLSSRLSAENNPLTAPEMALMQQWLTTLADTRSAAPPASPRRPRGSGKEARQ